MEPLSNEFEFPFTPYDIQLDFMNNMYSVLDEGKLGIFESPTGTGKSLSIICSALKWLKDNPQSYEEVVESKNILSDESTEIIEENTIESKPIPKPSWMLSHRNKRLEQEKDSWQKEQEKKKEKEQKKLEEIRQKEAWKTKRRKLNVNNDYESSNTKEIDKFCLEDYESDEEEDEDSQNSKKKKIVNKLLQKYEEDKLKLNSNQNQYPELIEENKTEIRQIFYCSRTHTQLSQFCNEIKKTIYSKNMKVITLGSRIKGPFFLQSINFTSYSNQYFGY